jgi:tetratricopeptide (TPR) repeat protein
MTTPIGAPRGTKARAARLAGQSSVRPPVTPIADPEQSPRPMAPGIPTSSPESGRELGPDELVALEEQRSFLLASLRDLEAEHDAGDIDDGDYEGLNDDYTARAAAVIRAIEGHRFLVAARRRPVSWSRRLAAVAVVVVLAVGAGVFVARSAGQRTAGATISGGTRESSRDQLLTARQFQAQQDYDGAIKVYDQVLQTDPVNVEALTFRGWMYRLKALKAGSGDQVDLLKQAIKGEGDALAVKPDAGPALVFLAVLYGDLQQPQKALDTLARAPAGSVPDEMSSLVDSFRQQMQAQLADTPTTTG